MSRIAKTDPFAAAAKTLTQRNLKQPLESGDVPREAQALVDLFLKFVAPTEGTQITATDVGRVVAQARANLIAKYGLEDDAPTKAEIEQASLAGKRAFDLAKALRVAPAAAD